MLGNYWKGVLHISGIFVEIILQKYTCECKRRLSLIIFFCIQFGKSFSLTMFAGRSNKNPIRSIKPGPAGNMKILCIGIFEPFMIAIHGVYFPAIYFGVQQVNNIQVLVDYGYDVNSTVKFKEVAL